MQLTARRLLNLWIAGILALIIVGSAIIFIKLKDDLSKNASKMEAELLMKALATTLRHDLLGGNLMTSGQRIKSLLEGTTGETICVAIYDSNHRLIISGGKESVCQAKGATEINETIYYDQAKMVPAFFAQLKYNVRNIALTISESLIFTSLVVISLTVLLLVFLSNFFSRLFHRINSVISGENINSPGNKEPLIQEEASIRETVELIKVKNKELNEVNLAKREAEVLTALAAQVSHDIRSPLSALNLVVSTLTNLPEEKRVLIRSSVNRINDIANDLLCKSKKRAANPSQNSAPKSSHTQVEMLSALVDLLVSEKRIQIRDKYNVDIEIDLSNSYGAFVEIDPTELKRTLSNLINNSIEAFSDSTPGRVKVQVRFLSKVSMITIQDNGKGIAPEILPLLGQQGFSHGKNSSPSGNGLGLWHARNTIEGAGGTFKIDSAPDSGTTVTITLPTAKRPDWFIDSLVLSSQQTIIVCDDDSSIHGLWTGRLNSLGSNGEGFKVLHFTGAEQFSIWQNQNPNVPNALYLMDYELLGSSKTGLDLIEEFKLNDQSILVTSRYEEESIRQRCSRLVVRIIPKAMAGFVPMEIKEAKQSLDGILIDDDQLVHATWKFAAKAKNKSFAGFYNHLDFLESADQFDVRSKIYVDSNLANGVRGEEIAKQIAEMGFENIYLCTGFHSTEFSHIPWIKNVLGKEPQF